MNDTRYVVDIDIGGTFTDVMISCRGNVACFKTDTTPTDLSQCFKDALERGAIGAGFSTIGLFLRKILVIRLSTSLSTNMLIEKKGAQVGLLLSRGRAAAYLEQLQPNRDERPVLFPDMLEEVEYSLDEDIREKSYRLLTRGVKALVVCLDESADFPIAENRVKSIIMKYFPRHTIGSVPVLLSCQVSRDQDYFKRINTALLNAYVHSALSRQILHIEDFLRDQGFPYPLLVIHANGGSARSAKSSAVCTLSSGAAAGIYGSQRLSLFYNKSHVVIVDVGGTSTEIGLIRQNRVVYAAPSWVGNISIDSPSPVQATLGIGGGSIVRINTEGILCFMPESVGAFPGPACYNLGGIEPTLTDAYLILGYFDENFFLGGQKRINKKAAMKVMKKRIADPLGITIEDAAFLIKKKAVEIIGKEIRKVILMENERPERFSLFAVGGGGGCLGSDLLDYAGLGELFVFRQGAVFGAYGSSGMDIVHQYREQMNVFWKKNDNEFSEIPRTLNKTILSLQMQAGNDMSGEGFLPQEIRFEVDLELKSFAAGKTCRLALPSPFLWPENAFFPVMKDLSAKKGIHITGVVLRALGDIPHAESAFQREKSTLKNREKGARRIYLGRGTFGEAPFFSWDELATPWAVTGPALIESGETTVWAPKGKTFEFDEYGNGIMKGL